MASPDTPNMQPTGTGTSPQRERSSAYAQDSIPGLTPGRNIHYLLKDGVARPGMIVNVLNAITGDCWITVFGIEQVDGFLVQQFRAPFDPFALKLLKTGDKAEYDALDMNKVQGGHWLFPVS